MDAQDIDKIDIIYTLGSILILAYTTPVAIVLALPLGYLQYRLRRSEWFTNKAAELHGLSAKPVQFLLPPPKSEEEDRTPLAFTGKTQKLNIPQDRSDLAFWQRITLPPDKNVYIDGVKSTPSIAKPHDDMTVLLKRVPTYFSYEQLPNPPTNTSIPIGYDLTSKKIMWMDLAKNFVHGLIAGMTGTGKDALMRLWYVYLTTYNSSQDIQFVILDGKNEWMLPSLTASPYMFVPPAGGIDLVQNEKGKWVLGSTARMAESLAHVFNEIQRRQQLFYDAGATNLASYELKTGNKLPRLIIIATDVGEDFQGDLETLTRILTMKARSFGVNLIISMQTSSKQDTGWRSNLSLVMSGYQGLQSADQPIMGINATNIQYRPSQLPNPEEYNVAKGLFVYRMGSRQGIVKTPHLPEEIFEQYIDKAVVSEDEVLIQRAMRKYGDKLANIQVITPLDLIQQDYQEYKPKANEWVLPQQDRIRVIQWRQQGWNKTQIMTQGLKYTSGPYYKQYSTDVDRLMAITDKSKGMRV